MSELNKLVRLLTKELALQEKILTVLGRERAAIVKLNREQVEELTREKEKLLVAAAELGEERRVLLAGLEKEETDGEPLRLADISQRCPDPAVRANLDALGEELRETVGSVKKLNEENGMLIRQSLGLIASTVAIMSARPEAALPTYGQKGKMSADEDPAFAPRSSSFSRSA